MQQHRPGEPGSEERIPKEPAEGQSQQTPVPEDQPAAESPSQEGGKPFGESRRGGESPRPTDIADAGQAAAQSAGPLREGAGEPSAETGGEVMSSLPRTRPQRRSERRTPAGGARTRGSTAARGKRPARARTPARAAARQRPKAQASARSTAPAARQARSRPAVSARSRRRPRAPELVMSTAVEAAKIPFRTALALTRFTGGLIGRGLRR